MSHKSYRPLTILAFRQIHYLSGLFATSNGVPFTSPIPHAFHTANVIMHALVTHLLFRLAKGLSAGFSREEAAWSSAAAALLFALHPVHSEAVAGVVGLAELLCAAAALPALMLYIRAAQLRREGCQLQEAAEEPSGFRLAELVLRDHCALQHAGLLLAALALTLVAAFCKELGITILGTFLVYDLVLADVGHAEGRPPTANSQARPAPDGGQAASATAGELRTHHSSFRAAAEVLQHSVRSLQALRLVCVVATGVVYVALRRAVTGGDQLVRIFRKVENPIAFAHRPVTRWMTTGYLHARYMQLLLVPWHLSVDWSFNCIPYVDSLLDARNLATAALYAGLTAVTLPVAACLAGAITLPSHHPPEAVLEPSSDVPAYRTGLRRRRPPPAEAAEKPAAAQPASAQLQGPAGVDQLRFFLVWGLTVAPFFPASNLLFYVGTFLAERLLYLPSTGFCILLAHLLLRLRPRRLRLATLACLLLAYATRTAVRNRAWTDDKALFRAASQVCPRSAKVQLNMGILESRKQQWEKAILHFRTAQEIDPGYCEPGYWIGVSLVKQGVNIAEGIERLEAAVSCPYVSADALHALKLILRTMGGGGGGGSGRGMLPGGEQASELWGRVLLDRLGSLVQGCAYMQAAAADHALAGRGEAAAELVQRCIAALQRASPPASAAGEAAVVPSQEARRALADCVAGRSAVLRSIASFGAASAAAQKELYRYLRLLGETCRSVEVQLHRQQQQQQQGGSGAAGQGELDLDGHMQLVHLVQRERPEDAWLQGEWGSILAEHGRPAEALTHLQVCAELIARRLSTLLPDASLSPAVVPNAEPLLADSDWPSLSGSSSTTVLEAADAAVRCLRLADRALADLSSDLSLRCRLRSAACRIQQIEAAILVHRRDSLPASAAAAIDPSATAAVRRVADCQHHLLSDATCRALLQPQLR